MQVPLVMQDQNSCLCDIPYRMAETNAYTHRHFVDNAVCMAEPVSWQHKAALVCSAVCMGETGHFLHSDVI